MGTCPPKLLLLFSVVYFVHTAHMQVSLFLYVLSKYKITIGTARIVVFFVHILHTSSLLYKNYLSAFMCVVMSSK